MLLLAPRNRRRSPRRRIQHLIVPLTKRPVPRQARESGLAEPDSVRPAGADRTFRSGSRQAFREPVSGARVLGFRPLIRYIHSIGGYRARPAGLGGALNSGQPGNVEQLEAHYYFPATARREQAADRGSAWSS